MVKLTGGGIQGNKVRQSRSGVKVEPKAEKVNVEAVAQQGAQLAFPRRGLIQGKGYEPKPMGPTGVPGKFNSAQQGPGSGRTVMPTGSQSTYGNVNPGQRDRAPDVPATSTGKDILKGYGPEASNKGR